MKPYNFIPSFFFIFLLPLFGSASTGFLPASDNHHASLADKEFSQIFTVSVAKEPMYLILVEKNLQRLRVLEFGNELRVVAEYPCATGENLGIKEIRGDSKTPEGIYFITQIFRDTKITIFGDRAFHLDYPNFFDRDAGRNGDGIFIHGTNKVLQPYSTNGCITLANHDLDHLEQFINQLTTPVVIVHELDSRNKINIAKLTENDFSLAKSLLLTEEIKPENIEYNYLYIVNLGNQTVAVGDFIYRPFNRSIMRGASRLYLKYWPTEGWIASQRLWRASPLQIYPEFPFKVLMARKSQSRALTAVSQTENTSIAANSRPGPINLMP
jgi:lipoprotein-anchoring transpeptidase ErfK/SrfK